VASYGSCQCHAWKITIRICERSLKTGAVMMCFMFTSSLYYKILLIEPSSSEHGLVCWCEVCNLNFQAQMIQDCDISQKFGFLGPFGVLDLAFRLQDCVYVLTRSFLAICGILCCWVLSGFLSRD